MKDKENLKKLLIRILPMTLAMGVPFALLFKSIPLGLSIGIALAIALDDEEKNES